MTELPETAGTRAAVPAGRRYWRWAGAMCVTLLIAYFGAAYVVLPMLWTRYERHHRDLRELPNVTHTGNGIPGDPLNVAMVGTQDQLKNSLHNAGWYVADRLGVRSDLRIAADTVLERPYDQAPVSDLYLFGRPEDIAFEQPVGGDPRRRHHVRFWKTTDPGLPGEAAWIGSATFDTRVGISHTTGQITHHIDANVDAERDRLLAALNQQGSLEDLYYLESFHTECEGKNGGGDRWHTDGRLGVAVLSGSP